MLQIRPFVWSLPLFVVMSIPLLAADSPAIGVLKDKGLTRSGRFLVIEAEQPVLDKWKEAKILVTEYMASVERKNEAEAASQEAAQLDEHRSELQRQLEELNQHINEQGFQQGNNQFRGGQGGGFGQGANGFGQGANGFGQGGMSQQLIAQRNMLRMELAEVQSTLKEVKSQAVKDPERKAMQEETKKRLEGCKATLSQMRKAVDEVTAQYDALKANSKVKSAMLTLEKEKLGGLKIGPSTAFANMVKTLEKAERMVLAKKATTIGSRKKVKLRK